MNGKSKNEDSRTLLAYIAVCIIWGSTYLAIRIGVGELPPMVFAGIRFITAGLLMLAFAKLKGLSLPKDISETGKISVVGIFLLFGGNGCVVWAETRVNSGIACLIVATVPLFMALIEFFLPSRLKMNLKGWIGLIVGFAGVALLVLSDMNTASIDMTGILLLLAGAFLWSIGSVYSKSFKSSASTVANIAIQMLSGGVCLFITGSLLGELSKIHITQRGIGALLYLIFFGSILGYSCYIYILQKWPAGKAGTYAYVNPPVALLLGTIFLGEPFSVKILLSTAVILGGVVLVQTSKTKAQA